MLHNAALSLTQNTTLPISSEDIKNKNYVGIFGKIVSNSKKPKIDLNRKNAIKRTKQRFMDSMISNAVGIGAGMVTQNKLKNSGKVKSTLGGFGAGIAARQGTQFLLNKMRPELYDPVTVSSDLAQLKLG